MGNQLKYCGSQRNIDQREEKKLEFSFILENQRLDYNNCHIGFKFPGNNKHHISQNFNDEKDYQQCICNEDQKISDEGMILLPIKYNKILHSNDLSITKIRKSQYLAKIRQCLEGFPIEFISNLEKVHPKVPAEFFDFNAENEPKCSLSLQTFSELVSPDNESIPIIMKAKETGQNNNKLRFTIYELQSFYTYQYNQFYGKQQKIMLEELQLEVDGQSFMTFGLIYMAIQFLSPYAELPYKCCCFIDFKEINYSKFYEKFGNFDKVPEPNPTPEIINWFVEHLKTDLKPLIQTKLEKIKDVILNENHYNQVFERIHYKIDTYEKLEYVKGLEEFYQYLQDFFSKNIDKIIHIKLENLFKSEIFIEDIKSYVENNGNVQDKHAECSQEKEKSESESEIIINHIDQIEVE